MPHSFALRSSLKSLWVAVVPALILGSAIATPVVAESVLPVPAFRSVTLTGGGRLILRHGSTHRVTLLEGNTSRTKATMSEGGRLIVEGNCARDYEPVIEVLTPEIDEIRVADGGTIETRGSFPRQAELDAAVEDGGTIDLRSVTVDVVAAAVHDGGRIFVRVEKSLAASVAQGGGITYWGNAKVTSSIQHGGFVVRGKATDADKPLPELGGGMPTPPLPPVPPVPPVPSIRG